MKPLLLGILCLFAIATQAQQFDKHHITYSSTAIGFYQFLPAGYNPASASKSPLIISLCGVGERGSGSDADLDLLTTAGIPLLINSGATMHFTYGAQQESFMVLAPQLPTSQGTWSEVYIDAMIDYATNNLNVDLNRIFLTGYSLGGGGVWKYITSSAARAAKIAGAIPISASADYYSGGFCFVGANKVAVWAFQAADDGTTVPSITQTAINGINACSPLVPARERLYPDGGHAIWNTRAYDTTTFWQYPSIFQWMMKVSRSINPATDVAPIANAGGASVVTLTVPVRDSDIPLNGLASSDADDIVSVYRWKEASTDVHKLYFQSTYGWGPTDSSDRPTASMITFSNNVSDWLQLGSYNFTLQVRDYKSQLSSVNVTYQVQLPAGGGNASPGAYIPNDSVVLSSTTTSTGFSGDAKDWDGTISAYNWREISGPQTATLSGTSSNVVGISNITTPGTYKFEFLVTDNLGATGADTATVVKLGASLPVTWLYFKGESINSQTLLAWATAQEMNNDHFEVLRSTDGTQFTSIGTVNATGATNGSAYTFTDANAPRGTGYYRLKQVDKDAKATYSNIISINNTGRGYAIITYPNPVKDNLSVVINGNLYGNLQVMVTDMQGRMVRLEQWTKTQSALTKNIGLTGLQSGMYQLILLSPDGKKETAGFVKY